MRYKIRGFGIIRSENAAKPSFQKSKFLVRFIAGLQHVESSVDYGAGKLRFLDDILARTDTLTIVDSTLQLERIQTIFSQKISIREFCAAYNSLSAVDTKTFSKYACRFDRAYLFNVLQIVPIPSIRRQILLRLNRSLNLGGELICCVQYRNSDFTRMSCMQNSHPYRDGFIIEHSRGTSFYGMIKPDALISLIENAGFKIQSKVLHDGSCYVIAIKC